MTHTNWVKLSLEKLTIKDQDKNSLIRFWNEFYSALSTDMKGTYKNTKSGEYKREVYDILISKKAVMPLKAEELRELQISIEDLTILFDEESIFKTVPNIIKILIRTEDVNAKDYLKKRLGSKEMNDLLSDFGPYTIEALIVHVLGTLFHALECSSIIRIQSLVEQLESRVRMQSSFLKSHRKKGLSIETDGLCQDESVNKRSKLGKMYPIGTCLVEFMESRKLITLMNDLHGNVRVLKRKGSFYIPSRLYAVCNFDISLLPIKLNLPMVCKPLDWTIACHECESPRTLSDLTGGYLSGPTGEIYDRYRLLSTGNINNFYIDIGGNFNCANLCSVMNKLQSQAFQINSPWLRNIEENKELFVENGYLMPFFLSSLNIKDVSSLLRDFYMKDAVISKICSFSELLNSFNKNIQRSRYEQLIINLAKAYDGYNFYLPAFLDFRGRIYRCGVLHFHECDLARSLIVFADSNSKSEDMGEAPIMPSFVASAFHYKSFRSFKEAEKWLTTKKSLIKKNPIVFARDAKAPFQFLSNLLGLPNRPITQDASSSAYQIMSYFLLDESLAKRTNLIQSSDGQISDVYSFLLEELKEFMKEELSENLSVIVSNLLTRKIVKGIFMPIIYGKTFISTASDLKEHLSHFITHKECLLVAKICFKFWRAKYTGMECLIRLIRNIGWISSARDCPVFYGVPYFTTVQDYMKMEAIKIWIYDSLNKKRRRVTLRVSSSKRDRRKTEISTFVNFIHQRDAFIAMSVVEQMLQADAPIYTVHDNFITTAQYSHLIPLYYSQAFNDMGPPLVIINQFIYMNVIEPILKWERVGDLEGLLTNNVITKDILTHYLKAHIPKTISKRMLATWEERISVILTSYEEYTLNVCGGFQSSNPRECFLAHVRKWSDFKFKLKQRGSTPYYCVHY